MLNRTELLFSMFDPSGFGLEIGPSYNPLLPKRRGYNVEIVDHADAATLREKYRDNASRIEEVDYVSDGRSLLETIGHEQRYDFIFASHVVEHVTDIVRFIQDCELAQFRRRFDQRIKQCGNRRLRLYPAQDHCGVDRAEFAQRFAKQPAGGPGGCWHAMEIKNDELRILLPFHKPARQVVDSPEGERSCQLIDVTVLLVFVENLLFVGLAVTPRGHAANIVVGDDAVSDVAAAVEKMQIKV